MILHPCRGAVCLDFFGESEEDEVALAGLGLEIRRVPNCPYVREFLKRESRVTYLGSSAIDIDTFQKARDWWKVLFQSAGFEIRPVVMRPVGSPEAS